jgi:hypothetical protein
VPEHAVTLETETRAGSTRVKKIVLTAAQTPTGNTTHVIEGRRFDKAWITLGTLGSAYTWEGKKLTWTGTADVDQIRIRTMQSPSWVAWHEIQIARE